MLWIIPAWIVSLVATFYLGYYLRGITKKIKQLEEVIQSKEDKQVKEPEPVSELIDPTDEVQTAIFEHQQMMKKLNPNEQDS